MNQTQDMVVSLSKGQNVSLSKEAPLMRKLKVNLLWKARETDGVDFDLDASVFALNEQGVVQNVRDFIYYRNEQDAVGSIKHMGDNRVGGGEEVLIDLDLVPAHIQKMAFVVTIDEAESRNQRFGQVDGAAIMLVDNTVANGKAFCRFDLSEDASTETAMLFAELYRNNGEWKFRAVGQGYKGGLAAFCRQYGLNPTA
ncbi:TerD family protein [Aeromonas sp. MrichA-1]|uniref:TerD family protein n=1 Tax=Aeromonas sp. MrichA-1 TaxID=2823362 RepID=UPI0032C1CB0B